MDFVSFLSIYAVLYTLSWCLRYICSAWFLDTRISTCFPFIQVRKIFVSRIKVCDKVKQLVNTTLIIPCVQVRTNSFLNPRIYWWITVTLKVTLSNLNSNGLTVLIVEYFSFDIASVAFRNGLRTLINPSMVFHSSPSGIRCVFWPSIKTAAIATCCSWILSSMCRVLLHLVTQLWTNSCSGSLRSFCFHAICMFPLLTCWSVQYISYIFQLLFVLLVNQMLF